MASINLYEEPAYYSELADKEITKEGVKEDCSRILNVCTYKVQKYINSHYGKSFLNEDSLKDMVQNTAVSIMGSISDYILTDKAVPFWAYINVCIRSAAKEAYRKETGAMGASAHVMREASKTVEKMHSEHLSEDEVAKSMHMKKSTVQSYVRLKCHTLSMDEPVALAAVDSFNEGDTLADRIGEKKQDILRRDSVDEVLKEEPGEVHEIVEKMLVSMNEEARFVIDNYLKYAPEDNWRELTMKACRQKNISESRTMDIIYRFRRRAKHELKDWEKNGRIGSV